MLPTTPNEPLSQMSAATVPTMYRRPFMTIAWLAITLMIASTMSACSGDDAYAGELRDEFLEACAPLGEDATDECECTFDRIREEYDEDRYRSQVRPAVEAGPDAWPQTVIDFRLDCLLESVREE